ncbi:uncharacterized protein LOC143020137 [Oratosquilla oratoria]|uniref:uncharacterized protein LOC143020137 n=1 Tax=Oratosquilla oratoria TaxID=337810 RepID=UPI003F769F2E
MMRRSMVLVVLGVVMVVLLEDVEAGICPKYPIIRDFDFQRYVGRWYQQDKLQSSWEAPGRCWKTDYSRDRKSGQFKMKMIFTSTITGRVEHYDSQLTLQGPAKPSVIQYSIPLTFMEDEFQVLATDYESFSVEYKCDPNGLLEKRESIWLLTREKNPSPLVLQRAYAIMHRYGIDIRKLERVDQTCGGVDIDPLDYPALDYPEQDYYNQPQELDNRRKQVQAYEEYIYDTEGTDYSDSEYYPSASSYYATHDPQSQPQPQVAQVAQTQHQVAQPQSQVPQQYYLAQPHKIRRHPGRKPQPNRRRNQDDRITLGQTLATKLWRVLHTPVTK